MASQPPSTAAARPAPELVAERYRLPRLWGRRAFWQIRLRWAVAPVMIAGVALGRLLGFELAAAPILAVALASLGYNALFAVVFSRYRERLEADPSLDRLFTQVEVAADYAAMFLLIHFTGGIASPLVVFLLFHVVIAAVQFSAATAYALAGVAGGGLSLIFLGQIGGWLHGPPVAFDGVPLHALDRPSGSAVTLLFFGATLFLTAGIVSRIMDRLRDRVAAQAETTAELERLMRERASFMLEVAHNLRTPLAAGLSIVELLADGYVGELTSQQRQHVERLEGRLRTLDRTIGELLAIARTRDRSRHFEPRVVELERLARHTEELFADEAARREIELRVVLGDDPPAVAGGRGLLEQVVENLVSNAVKYTPAGGRVEVRLEGVRREDGTEARITVEDTGIGVPAAEQGRLFREFFRASNARRTHADGTGLGLVLVRQTVERHGGSVELTSEEGRGTKVVVRLPAAEAGGAGAAEE